MFTKAVRPSEKIRVSTEIGLGQHRESELTDDERRHDELNEAQLHVAESHGGAVAHGRHLQTLGLLAVPLSAELLHHQVSPLRADLRTVADTQSVSRFSSSLRKMRTNGPRMAWRGWRCPSSARPAP